MASCLSCKYSPGGSGYCRSHLNESALSNWSLEVSTGIRQPMLIVGICPMVSTLAYNWLTSTLAKHRSPLWVMVRPYGVRRLENHLLEIRLP